MNRRIFQVSFLLAIPVLALFGPAFLLKSDVSASARLPTNFNQERIATAQEGFAPNNYYRFTTKWRGDGKSLDIVNDGKLNNQLRLTDTGNFSGQRWRITPIGDGYYRFTSEWRGNSKSIDVVNDGKNNQLIMADTGNYSGQFWKITSLGGGYYRLTTQWQGDGKSLDIVNDGKNNQVILAGTGNFSGQIWKITKIK